MRALALVLFVVSVPTWAAETMRIAMQQDVDAVVIEGTGLAFGEDVDELAPVPLERDRATVTRRNGHLEVDGVPVPQTAVRLRSLAGDEAPMRVNNLRVRGDVVVVPGPRGLITINVLALESYLAGVLGSEMPKTFPLEALKAQAVAARTYALTKKLEQYGQPFHLGSSVISQVYKGLDAEDPRTHEAVTSTRGMVLTWQLQPIEAYFHASCGGHTETGGEALGRDLPYLRSVTCPCASLPTTSWSLSVPTADLKRLGASKAPSVQVDGRSPTGRARRVSVGSRSWDAVKFRERLGYMNLRSLDFSVARTSKDGVVLNGRGFGHGAGLCQWGANVLASRGWSFERILQHYYAGTELQTLY